MFHHYRIPIDNWLCKTDRIDEDGNYHSPTKNKSGRLGSSLGALSSGRVNICILAYVMLSKAITIALRYSMSRRQFGPDDSKIEYPVIEYQTQVKYKMFLKTLNYYILIYCVL